MPTTYYVDPSQSSDRLGAARVQYGQELDPWLQAGDTVLYRRGFHHDGSGNKNWLQTRVGLSNITIGAYGTGDKPYLDARCWEPPGAVGWTPLMQASTSRGSVVIWRKLMVTANTGGLKRLWTGARKIDDGISDGTRIEGESRGRVPGTKSTLPDRIDDEWNLLPYNASTNPGGVDEATVLARILAGYDRRGYIWASLQGQAKWLNPGSGNMELVPGQDATRYLYVLVPGTDMALTPPAYYGGLAYLQAGTSSVIGESSPLGVRFRDCSNTVIEDIIAGGASGAIDLEPPVAANCNGFTVRRCEARHWFARGIQVSTQSASYSGAGRPMSNILIGGSRANRNIVNSRPTKDEQDPDTPSGWFSGAESIEVAAYDPDSTVDNVEVSWNGVYGLQHNGVNVLGATGGIMTNTRVMFNEIDAEDFMTDSRALSVTGLTGPNNLVLGNIGRNHCVKSEFTGSVTVEFNWWIGHRRSISQPGNECAVRLGPINDTEAPTTLKFRDNFIVACNAMGVTVTNVGQALGSIEIKRLLVQLVGDDPAFTDSAIALKVFYGTGGAIPDGAVTVDGIHAESAIGTPQLSWRQSSGDSLLLGPLVAGHGKASRYVRVTDSPYLSTLYPPESPPVRRGNIW